MPKRKKTKTTQSKPIAILDAPANPDKISLKTWQVYAAQSAFVLLDKKPDAHNIDFLILKKHFENYAISKEGTKLKAEIEQVRFKQELILNSKNCLIMPVILKIKIFKKWRRF